MSKKKTAQEQTVRQQERDETKSRTADSVSIPHNTTSAPNNQQPTFTATPIYDFGSRAGYLVRDVFYLFARDDVTPQCLLNAVQQGASFVRYRRDGRLHMLDLQPAYEFCANALATMNGYATADEMYQAHPQNIRARNSIVG